MDIEHQIKLYNLQEAKAKAERAIYESLAAYNLIRPCWQLPIAIRRDGSRWLCVLETSRDFLECPAAYGDCPRQALENFDALWVGAGLKLEDYVDENNLPEGFYEEEDEDDDDEEEYVEEW